MFDKNKSANVRDLESDHIFFYGIFAGGIQLREQSHLSEINSSDTGNLLKSTIPDFLHFLQTQVNALKLCSVLVDSQSPAHPPLPSSQGWYNVRGPMQPERTRTDETGT